MKLKEGSKAARNPSASTALNREDKHEVPNYSACPQDQPTHAGVSIWVTRPIRPASPFQTCCGRVYRIFLEPFFYAAGQCAFGIAMLSIITGVALCIWGYMGSSNDPFKIAGPLCIGIGVLIYVVGCFVCCGECSRYEKALAQRALENKTTSVLDHLAKDEVIRWMQSDQRVYEEFRQLSSSILDRRR